MKDLIIVGAGDSGQELHAWSEPHLAAMSLRFKGFLDDDLSKPNVIGNVSDYLPQENDVFICSIGNPVTKMNVTAVFVAKGAVFINLIHPTAVVCSTLDQYCGIVIAPFVYIANKVKLSNHVALNVSASVGHDVVIGEGCNISSHCDITGHVTIGKEVFMGSHACVIPGRKIGDNAVIAAGSAVMTNVPPGVIMLGVPAKLFK